MSEILTEFTPGPPADWSLKRIDQLCSSCRAGGTPSRGEKAYWMGGAIPFAMIEDLTGCGLYLWGTRDTITTAGINASSAWIVPPGAVLVSMYATVGETAINSVPMATNQAILALQVLPDYSAEYVAYCISYFRGWLLRRRVESTQKNINKGIVTAFEIPIPPLEEQRRIAAVLWAVQRAVQQQQRLVALATELKNALMHKLLTGGTRGEPLKQTEMGKVPESWRVVECQRLAVLQRGVDLTRSEFRCGEFPVAGSNGIIGYHDTANVRGPGVTVGRSGSVGKVNFYEGAFWAHNTALYVKDFCGNDPRYTAFHLERLSLGRFKSGASVPTLDRNVFKTLPVALPPVDEQQLIAGTLRAVDLKVAVEARRKDALEVLFRTLLHHLMTAHIRVHDLELSALEEATQSAGAV